MCHISLCAHGNLPLYIVIFDDLILNIWDALVVIRFYVEVADSPCHLTLPLPPVSCIYFGEEFLYRPDKNGRTPRDFLGYIPC